MKNFENYLKNMELEIEDVFDSLEKEIDEFRIRLIDDGINPRISRKTYFKYILSEIEKINEIINHLKGLITPLHKEIVRFRDENPDEKYCNTYAQELFYYIAYMHNMYMEIYHSYKPLSDEAEKFFNI